MHSVKSTILDLVTIGVMLAGPVGMMLAALTLGFIQLWPRKR